MKKGIFCVVVCMMMISAIPSVIGQTNTCIGENELNKNTESSRVLLYPVVKIGWNMSTTDYELLQTGFLARLLSGPGNTNGVEWGIGSPLGGLEILLGSKWKVTKGEMILSPIGMKLVTVTAGDTIRWLFFGSFSTTGWQNNWISGRAFGVIVEKA